MGSTLIPKICKYCGGAVPDSIPEPFCTVEHKRRYFTGEIYVPKRNEANPARESGPLVVQTMKTLLTPLYPDIKVKLTGEDGNAFFIIGKVKRALINARVPAEIVSQFVDEATSGDYDKVLQTAIKYVEVI